MVISRRLKIVVTKRKTVKEIINTVVLMIHNDSFHHSVKIITKHLTFLCLSCHNAILLEKTVHIM